MIRFGYNLRLMSTTRRASNTVPRLVETEWVALNMKTIVPIDASWHMPATKRSALTEFQQQHLPNGRFFDVDAISDQSTDLPHMLPSERDFEAHMDAMGVQNEDHVVIYDNSDILSSYRVWWTFKTFGHERVSVMHGGLWKWIQEKRSLVSGNANIKATKGYQASLNPALVRDYNQVVQTISTRDAQIVDARPVGRFDKTAPEPRAGLPSGHMPGAISLPFIELMDPSKNRKVFLGKDQLKEQFTKRGIDLTQPIVCSCGSGVTASVVFFAAEMLGASKLSLYDGSWTEYASKKDSKIEHK